MRGGTMDINNLQRLKEKIEFFKAEKAKCLGQEQQLNEQKKELMQEFKELGVTRDTLPQVIKQLETDISAHEKEINLVLDGIRALS